jgi:signal peptidase II
MTATMRRNLVRYGLILGVVVLVAGLDLWSKRWAEDNLATPRHLLPVTAHAQAEGMTVGDVVRTRFPDMADEALRGTVFLLPPAVHLEPGDPVHELEVARGLDAAGGFFIFDPGNEQRFARYVDRSDQIRLERELLKNSPGIAYPEARRQIREQLAQVSVSAWLMGRFRHLSEAHASAIARSGMHALSGTGSDVDPSSPARAGATYLVGNRQLDLIPGHLDFSYAENPAGAWGLMLNVEEGLRRVIFFVLSLVAIAAIAYLVIRPPSDHWVPLVALGAILGGAIGNLVDRVLLAYVVDFIHMYWGEWSWPRYNVADIGITVGVIVLVLVTGFSKAPAESPPSTKA